MGLAYSCEIGLVVATTQEEADTVAKEIPKVNLLAHRGFVTLLAA
jgi:hypothetical protein